MRWTRTLTGFCIAAALAGCASKPPATALREGPRMIDLYRGAAPAADDDARRTAGGPPAAARCRWWPFVWPCGATQADPGEDRFREERSYARTAASELEMLFPRLPNPDIYVYVPPHLATASRIPVPGYTTAVPLYVRVEYALPGETPGPAGTAEGEGAEDGP